VRLGKRQLVKKVGLDRLHWTHPQLQMVTSIDGLGNQSEDLMIIKTSVEKYEKVGN
jgi:hypothetical protein